MSILIAEDNVAQRHYLREILEKEFPSNAPVVEAADGEEAVKLALEHKPDVCILDIQMPKLSGVKAARSCCRDASAEPVLSVAGETENFGRKVRAGENFDDAVVLTR